MSTEVRVAHDAAERPEPSVKSEDSASTGKHVTGSPEWLDYMTDRSERGDAQAHFSLGQYHYERKEYTIALSYFNMADNKGNIQATYQLAVMYYDGLGVTENQHKGIQYMRVVAETKNKKYQHLVPSAQFNVGQACLQGFGINQSDDEAIRWWTLAANAADQEDIGCIKSQNALGMMFSRNDTLNLEQALHWHRLAAESGHLESMAAVGQMYCNGHGCDVDKLNGVKWLKEASSRGCMYATGLLSREYFTSKLYSRAVEYASKICDLDREKAQALQEQFLPELVYRGIAMSCFIIARCLQLGQGIEKSDEKAKEYFDKASQFDKDITSDLHTKMMFGIM